MTISSGSAVSANDVRGLFNIFSALATNQDQRTGGNGLEWKSKFSADTNLIRLNNTDWATTTTGMTTETSEGNYYCGTAGGFTLTSFAFPLLSTNSKVTLVPHYEIFKLYDECDDSSVSGTNWVKTGTATATEDTHKIAFPANSVYHTSNLSAENLITFRYYGAAENDGVVTIDFYDGTNSVNLFTLTSSSGGGYNYYAQGVITIRLDFTNKRALVSFRQTGGRTTYTVNYATNQDEFTQLIDLSSLSTNCYLNMTVTNHATSLLHIYYLRLGKASPSTTITNSYSRDNTNYTNMTNGYVTSTGTGTTITAKSTGTVASNEVLVFKGWTISEEKP